MLGVEGRRWLPVRAGALAVVAASSAFGVATYPHRGFDVRAYSIDVELFPEGDSIRARAAIDLVVSDSAISRLRFDLAGLTVDSLRVGGEAESFEREAGGLRIELAAPATAGDSLRVEVFYSGAPRDGLVFRRNAYGRRTAFADNWPNRAHYWFPCVDHPSDKARVTFRVRAPEGWEVVAPGLPANRPAAERSEPADESEPPDGSQPADGSEVAIWSTDHPIPVYTMVVGAAEMSVTQLGDPVCEPGGRCVRLTAWTDPQDAQVGSRTFARAPQVVALFDSLIAPFPYAKLALVQSSTRFGGMENSSAIFFSESGVRRGGDDPVVPHEIAHQWFGDSVTEREWSHIWLSEGFATYFATVFYELRGPPGTAERLRVGDEVRYLDSRADVQRPVIDAEPADLMDLLNRNSYQKGAWVLHMLRQVVGDEAFFAGIRLYYDRHRDGTALSEDLRAAMEEASGQQLSWFFDQWLRQPGYPEVEVSGAWDEGGKALRLRIAQRQRWAPFRLPLVIEAVGEGYALRKTFWIDKGEEERTWELPARPQTLEADPDDAVLGPVTIRRAGSNTP